MFSFDRNGICHIYENFLSLYSLREVRVFFFIGGVQPKKVRLDRHARSCPSCGRMSLFHERLDHYLSLFFIPLFPVKKGVPYLVCESCDSGYKEDGTRLEEGRARFGRNCSRCGRTLESDFIYCPYCGKTL